jgi:hypothetical protein
MTPEQKRALQNAVAGGMSIRSAAHRLGVSYGSAQRALSPPDREKNRTRCAAWRERERAKRPLCLDCGAPATAARDRCATCYAAHVRGRQLAAPPASSVAWCDYLSLIREAAGGSKKGTCVSIGQSGVTVSRVALEPLTFATLDDALDHFTRAD